MASTIAAVTTGGGGVITTADSSGDLSLLSGVNTVVAVTSAGVAVTGTLSSSGASTLTGAITATAGINTPNTFGFKNRIINGGMVIDQRNAGASVTPTIDSTYTLDRWLARLSQASKFSVQQNAGSVTLPTGFTNYLGVTSLSAYSVSATDYFNVQQRIEGFNVADLGWGTASAATVTISFRVYSSLTGTFGGTVLNNAADRSYPFSYSIPVANTWTTISVTIAGDTSGTWLKTNGNGLMLYFSLGTGTTYSGTAGAWAGTAYFSATGAVSVVGTSGATFYITGVQLEKGSTATSFDFRAYSTELAMCQRYYMQYSETTNPGTIGFGTSGNTNAAFGIPIPITMRTPPTITMVGSWSFRQGAADNIITSLGTINMAPGVLQIQGALSSSAGNGIAGNILSLSSPGGYLLSAEL
jgi:hypothetical protein